MSEEGADARGLWCEWAYGGHHFKGIGLEGRRSGLQAAERAGRTPAPTCVLPGGGTPVPSPGRYVSPPPGESQVIAGEGNILRGLLS